MRASEIHVKRIRVNQGLGVLIIPYRGRWVDLDHPYVRKKVVLN